MTIATLVRTDGEPRVATDERPLFASAAPSAARRLLWRWRPSTAPRLRLAAGVRPQSRLELVLCELFRCQREWTAPDLVARLACALRDAVPFERLQVLRLDRAESFVLYVPDDAPRAALVTTGPLTSVKEQAAGAYAKALAERGFASLAFDHRTFGESEGRPRQFENPVAKIADIRAAVAGAPENALDRRSLEEVEADGKRPGPEPSGGRDPDHLP